MVSSLYRGCSLVFLHHTNHSPLFWLAYFEELVHHLYSYQKSVISSLPQTWVIFFKTEAWWSKLGTWIYFFINRESWIRLLGTGIWERNSKLGLALSNTLSLGISLFSTLGFLIIILIFSARNWDSVPHSRPSFNEKTFKCRVFYVINHTDYQTCLLGIHREIPCDRACVIFRLVFKILPLLSCCSHF